VSGSSDQSIKVWDALTGECLHTLVGHTDLVRTLQLDSKSKTIVSGSYDGSLKIWRLEDGKLLRTLNQSLHGR
jgi:WD40 repeat protein